MQLPFTVEQFYGVFREYNTTLWPAQVFLVALALAAIALVVVPCRWSGVGVSAILAFLWGLARSCLPPRIFHIHQSTGSMPSLVYRWLAPSSSFGTPLFVASLSSDWPAAR